LHQTQPKRQIEQTAGDRVEIVIAREAKQSSEQRSTDWIASSLTLLAMTVFGATSWLTG
jgi:hypothetical protein